MRATGALLLCFAAGYSADCTGWVPAEIRDVEYPVLANQARVEGIVTASVLVGENGSVRDVSIGSGDRLLIGSVKQTLLAWKFMKCGFRSKRVEHEFMFTFTFRLKGTTSHRPQTRFTYMHPYKVIVQAEAVEWMP
jgi:outer membrane biosynthesis protein TonB